MLSGMIAGAYTQGQLGEMITVERVTAVEGRARVFGNQGSALLVIPKGFAADFLDGKPVQFPLLTNPAQRIAPSLLEEVTSVLLEAGSTLRRLAPEPLINAFRGTQAPTDAQVVASSLALNREAGKLAKLFYPPLISIKETAIAPGPKFSFGLAMFPSALFTALMMLAFALSNDIWKERQGGTLRRVIASGSNAGAFLAGKSVAFLAVALTFGAAGLIAGRLLLALTVSQPVRALIWIGAAAVSLYLMMLFLQTCSDNARTGNILGNLALLPFLLAGGCIFPFELMPAGFVHIGRWTPNGWALLELKSMLQGTLPGSQFARDMAITAAWCTALFLIVRRRIVVRSGA